MTYSKVGKLFKFNTFLAFPAFVLYVVGFASHTWLELNFELPPQPPTITVNIPVEATMGLYTACKHIHYPSPTGENVVEECSPDGAAKWQFVACGLAIVGLVLSFLGLLLAILFLFCKRKNCMKFVIICCNFLSAGLMTAPLLMYAINRKFQVNPPLPYIYDFNLAWGYFVAAASACLLAIVTVLNILENVWSSSEPNHTVDEDRYSEPIVSGTSEHQGS
ncbi:hypothetical protein Btru_032547 [Bulinus truncatus]|nr:hypothetical protein Btru_032547 [Bulinus truncatus]